MFHVGLDMAASQASTTYDPWFPPSAFPKKHRGTFPLGKILLPLWLSILQGWGRVGGGEAGEAQEILFSIKLLSGQRTNLLQLS